MSNKTFSISPEKRSMMGNIINLMTLAYLDGTVTDEEKHIIGEIAHSYGLSKEEFEFCADKAEEGLKEGKSVIETPEDDNAKVLFLKNLVMTMMCDGNIDKNEEDFVHFIADKFGYKADEVVEYLKKSIVEEYCGKEEGQTEVDQEALKEEMALGKEAMENHDIRTAFDHLFFPAHLDREAFQLFLRIPNNEQWLWFLSEEQIGLLKEYVEKGDLVAQYTLGRYHQVVEGSYDEASNLLVAAGKAGIPDASAALAIMYRRGQLGEVEIDKDKYFYSLTDACEKGSALANYELFKMDILGLDGREAHPQDMIDSIKQWLNGDENEDILKINPINYELLGLAYQVLGDWDNAASYYLKCVQMGYVEMYPEYIIVSTYNHDYDLVNEEGYEKGVETGCKLGVPYCFYMRSNLNKDRYENTDDANEREALHKLIAEDLNLASRLGDGNATLQLGYHYYYGEYGFEENDEQAWSEFIGATTMNIADAWSMLAQIVLDGNAPEDKLPAGFVAHCRLMALRLGDQDQLIPVIMAYRNRALGKYTNEITKYYMPQYEALSDEEKVSYFGLSFIALIKPEGKADLIEFDLERETWDELCEVIDAKQLAPIRSGALKKIAKDVELEDDITAWIDNEGQAKGLEENPIGDKIYPGPVLGYLILTQEDENGEPHCFDNIYELEEVIEQLGCEVENIYYEEFPEDDGRYDPYV